jgi:Tol biopolymer transport system component
LVDIDGIETEVASTPDGSRFAVVATGDLWVVNPATGDRKQLTRTAEFESAPAWMPDGRGITFTRGKDTFAADPETGVEKLFLPNATSLAWSHTSRTTFVRDRALWIANPNQQAAKALVDADLIPDVDIHSPRFSPDALEIAFIKSQLGLRGEVWIVDVLNGMARALVSDRVAENPLDVGWINEGRELAYLTNRAGAYSIWYVDLAASTIQPLTVPLVTVPLGRIGMAVIRDRIVLPRHFADSNIVLSDGTAVASSEQLEFQPAVSMDGTRVVYTVADENKFEIWTAGIQGENPSFRTLGREPRFAPNGFEVVYTYTDLNGNDDIWKLDIRDNSTERLTDAEEVDVTADSAYGGQSIAFASARGGTMSIWTIPASGGKRLRLNEGGYAPRFSPDGKSILFWNNKSLWTMDAHGGNVREIAQEVTEPKAGVWSRWPKGPAVLMRPPVDRFAWPGFDTFPDGRFVFAPIDIRETALWAIDLTYREN